jgi:hypothetical protein
MRTSSLWQTGVELEGVSENQETPCTIVTEQRIREVGMLQLVRVSEKNEELGELECTPRWRMSQNRDSRNTGHRSQDC